MFNHFIKKAFAAIILFITTFFALPVLYARADYRMEPERKGTISLGDGKLYDEYGRVDFKNEATGKVKAQDKIKKIAQNSVVYSIVENKEWRITLESEKVNYETEDPVNVRAFLEYIGSKKSKEISICDPVIGFYLESSTGTFICQYAGYSSSEPYPPKKFKKGKKYEVKLDLHEWDEVNSDESDMTKAMSQFHNENGELILPKGSYTVKAGMTNLASKKSSTGRQTGFFATLHFNIGTEGEIFAVGKNLFRTLGDKEAVLIGTTAEGTSFYNGDIEGEDWVIPSTVIYNGNKRSVTVIGDEGIEYTMTDADDGSTYYVQYGAFSGKSFSSIRIPASVKKISNRALAGIHGMNEVIIDAEKIKIGKEAFADCSWGITEDKPGKLVISAKNVNIDEKAFSDCYLLQNIKINASKSLVIGDEAFNGCYNLLKIKLPQKTKYIGNKAFYDCGYDKKLTITIPDGVKYIGKAVVNRANLKLSDGNTAYKVENGLLLTADGKTVVRVMSRKQEEIVIPDTVTEIMPGAFEKSKAESLTIPDSVSVIPDNMMRDAVSLTTLNLGNGITSIGEYAFYNTRMRTVKIPGSVKSIGIAAFGNNSKLKKVRLSKGLESIGDYAFYSYNTKLDGLTIPNTVKYVGQYITGINYDNPDFAIVFKDGNSCYEQSGKEVFTPGTGELKYLVAYPLTYNGPELTDNSNPEINYFYAPKLSERVESIEKLSFVGYTNSLILPASLKTMDIAFLPKIMDPEEGGTLIFTGKEPPVITNDYETTGRISLLVIIPYDADIEAYQNAFDNAGLSENQHVYVKRAGE
ncbi:MAG: leucine-rich repeat domain-containing protein [Lachnospiraceae bacterium]|nr:leucine-rich repeat domain-containing protein [Lachnospiraceae bacterium]